MTDLPRLRQTSGKMPTKVQRVHSAKEVEDTLTLPVANFQGAPLWTKFAYAQTIVGFLLMLFAFHHMTSPETSYGGLPAEVCFLFAFFAYLTGLGVVLMLVYRCETGLGFVLVLVYVPDARDNKLIEIALMICCYVAALLLAIGISIWGSSAANDRRHTINMVPVGIAVSSSIMALLAGIFSSLELFNFGR